MQPNILSVKMLKNRLQMVKYDGMYKSPLLEKLIPIAIHKEKFVHRKEQGHVAELEMSTNLVLDKFNDVN